MKLALFVFAVSRVAESFAYKKKISQVLERYIALYSIKILEWVIPRCGFPLCYWFPFWIELVTDVIMTIESRERNCDERPHSKNIDLIGNEDEDNAVEP